MADITLSKAVRSNLLNLQSTANSLAKTQERLATGLKVNSALDNPNNFFTASALNSRAGDLSNLLDSASNGIKTIEAADNGLTAITKTVETLQATARQARQDKSFKATSYTIDAAATGNLSFSGGSVGTTAVNVALTGASTTPTAGTSVTGAFSAFTLETAAGATSGGVTAAGAFSAQAFTAETTASTSFTFAGVTLDDAGDTISFDIDLDGTGVQTVTITQAIAQANSVGNDGVLDTIGEFQAALGAAIEATTYTAGDFALSNDGTDITLASTTAGSGGSVVITNAAFNDNAGADTLASTGGIANANVSGADEDVLAFDVDVDGVNQTFSFTTTEVNAAIGGNTISSLAELATVINTKLTGAVADGSGANLVLTSSGSGATSNVDVNSITFDDDGAGAAATNFTGFNGTTGQAGTAGSAVGTPDSITFNIDVDGNGATAVTLTAAQIGAIGNNDQSVDTIAEYQSLVQAGLTAAGVTGVTVSNDGSALTFTSGTTGVGSTIDITGATANNNNATTALAIGNTGLNAPTEVDGLATGGIAVRTVDQLVTAINADTNLTDKVRASNDNGRLRIENLSTEDLTVTGYNSTSSTVDGGVGTSTIGGNDVRKNLVNQYNELRNQLDKIADDASFNGINLLRGDKLKLTFNETGTSTIEIQAKDASGNATAVNTSKLGISAVTNADFDSDTSIDGKLEALSNALNTLRSHSSAFGSNLSIVQNRQDFTKDLINTLETGAANLTLADTNEEAANLLALQTRQQLSSTALSLASQADQNVLRLF